MKAIAPDVSRSGRSARSARSPWSTAEAPEPGVVCSVVIPVRNESQLLPRALTALAMQRGVPARSYEVLVLANNCDDDTAAVARRFAAGCTACAVHVADVRLTRDRANVGAARRLLMDEAMHRLVLINPRSPGGGVILSTDGDTRVEPDWIRTTLAAIGRGADAVGGRILTDREASWTPQIGRVQRLDTLYHLLRSRLESRLDPDPADPWPRHHQHFGASLAVTVDAYRRIGGLPNVPYLEDEAMVTALRVADARIRHAPEVRVRTSGRLEGRAEVGLSWQLGQWADQLTRHEEPWVVDPGVEQALWTLRQNARAAWRSRGPRVGHGAKQVDAAIAQAADIDAIASALHLGLRWTRAHFEIDQPFGRLWAGIEARWFERRKAPLRRVRMRDAVSDLRRRIAVAGASSQCSEPLAPSSRA